MKISRRALAPAAGIAFTAGYSAMKTNDKAAVERIGGEKSAVTIAKVSSYSQDLVRPILDGLQACGLDVRGKSILLKPNLVEFDDRAAINTDPAVVAAAYEAFGRLGASSVVVAEGPGHRRDTFDLSRQAGYTLPLVDLNRDDVFEVHGFADEPQLFLPGTALRADLIVSLPKMKTHHWAGVTLSMKNLFGLVPGSVYGWPKNRLHHIGIARSILELNRTFRNTFAIVDGIVGMEGNGPIQGNRKPAGALVMGRDLRAADATCCRVMGINPERVDYLAEAGLLGHLDESWIEQRGEPIQSVAGEFALIPQFSSLRLSPLDRSVHHQSYPIP